MAGLLEMVNEESGRHDLYRLADELAMELDDLLPIVEAVELMGFATVSEGDIVLTPLGQAYADASILARKEMLAGRALRLPTIRWVYETLQADNDHRIAEKYFLEKLQAEFGDYAEAQLDTAINWGRYAELFEFDDDTDELYVQAQ
jgi:NitT/TauT family transport system ATP-binding protein